VKHVLNDIKDIDTKKVYLHGRSLGGAVAIYAATHVKEGKQIRGVILENTFTCMSDMVDAVLGRLSFLKHLILRNHWSSIELIHKIQVPVMFIKAKQDELVPFAHMNRLSDQIKKDGHGNFTEYIIENGTHNNTWELNREEYFGEIAKFFQQCESQ